jgi:anti-sigma factor RsiW
MKCSLCVELIAAKLTGTLPEDTDRELEKHLAGCSRCRAELQLQRKIHASLLEAAPSGLPDGFTQRIRYELKASDRAARRRLAWGSLVPVAALATGIVLAFVFRFQIDRVVPPAMEGLASRIAGPLASFGDGILALLARLPAPAEESTWIEGIQPLLTNTLVLSVGACVAIFWALGKVYTYLVE